MTETKKSTLNKKTPALLMLVLGLCAGLSYEKVFADEVSDKQSVDEKVKITNKLSDEQKEKIKALKGKFKDSIQPKIAELSKHKRSLQDLLTRETLDKDAILKEQEAVNGLTGDIAREKIAFRIDSAENLTPAQRKVFSEKRNRKHHGKTHRGHKGESSQT